MHTRAQAPAVPRLTYLRIKNYRALRDVEFRDLTPLTVFIGPNGSGKSTVLDALDFLAEAVRGNLVGAWEKRNRFAGMRTRGSEGNIEFEVEIYFDNKTPHLHYKIVLDESNATAFVADEVLSLVDANLERLFYLDRSAVNHPRYEGFENIEKVNGYFDNIGNSYINAKSRSLLSSALVTAETIQQPWALALWVANVLSSYRYVHLTDDHLKGYSDAGPREKLSPNGDNLPNVLYHLHTKHPDVLANITAQMRGWVPGLADIVPEITSDERLLLRFRDGPFEKPLPAQYMSDGTMRLAALLTLLYEPNAAGLLGLEEPENELHPRLLTRLAEELMKATETRQLLMATHSPFLLDSFEPEQVWILHRGPDGYTQATRTADIPHVKQMVEDGSPLGYLWTSNFFTVGDPLTSRNAAPDAR
ncbi:AAA family ATPase [Hymenobacter terrenus]|uniref:AAA family ATPase n=1 Tax=Hymenobacter terrenus TaxID=1629124 RepID=UPI0006197782|nr:AAA family ATPase [Hymenobacter terrenus]